MLGAELSDERCELGREARVAGLDDRVVVGADHEVHLGGDDYVHPFVVDHRLVNGVELGVTSVAAAALVASVARCALLVRNDRDKCRAVRCREVGCVGDLGPEQDQLDLTGDDLVFQGALGLLELCRAVGQQVWACADEENMRNVLAAAIRAMTVALVECRLMSKL